VAQENSQVADGAAKIDTPIKEVKLPGTVANLCVGGNGRYILLHFADLRKIGVFDINELKIAGYIPANDDDVRFVPVCLSLCSDVAVAYPMQGDKCKKHRSNMRSFQHHENSSSDRESKSTKR
jgi:hypothetical protein